MQQYDEQIVEIERPDQEGDVHETCRVGCQSLMVDDLRMNFLASNLWSHRDFQSKRWSGMPSMASKPGSESWLCYHVKLKIGRSEFVRVDFDLLTPLRLLFVSLSCPWWPLYDCLV